jgi:hypothetical protein
LLEDATGNGIDHNLRLSGSLREDVRGNGIDHNLRFSGSLREDVRGGPKGRWREGGTFEGVLREFCVLARVCERDRDRDRDREREREERCDLM